jgi:hypothetical protein
MEDDLKYSMNIYLIASIIYNKGLFVLNERPLSKSGQESFPARIDI